MARKRIILLLPEQLLEHYTEQAKILGRTRNSLLEEILEQNQTGSKLDEITIKLDKVLTALRNLR